MINDDNVSNRNNKYLENNLQNEGSGNNDWRQTSDFCIRIVTSYDFLPTDKETGKNSREAVQVLSL